MKLIECYIENFGKLSSYSLKFSESLNVINASNGYGKTTFSVFIKSMLYGIDSKRSKGEENDRKRYAPWQGGRFGGSLTFENDGRIYRIERTFAEKGSADLFNVYDVESGALSNDFTENIGEELFGIDADGFERTVFLSEKNLAVNGSNHTVAAKLSNLVGVDGDMGNFDKALDALLKMEKHYQHRRGSGGIIGSIKSEITSLEGDLLAICAKRTEAQKTEARAAEISEKLNLTTKKRQEIESKKSLAEYETEYLKKKEALQKCEEEILDIKAFFGGLPPTRDEVRIYEKKKNDASSLRDAIRHQCAEAEESSIHYLKETNEHINAIENAKCTENVNNTCLLYLFFAVFIAFASVALGFIAHTICFVGALAALPFIYLAVSKFAFKSESLSHSSKVLDDAKLFIMKTKGLLLTEEQVYPYLCRMKGELSAKETEIENRRRSIAASEERIQALTEEYSAFLGRYSLSGDTAFDEIGQKLSAYESLSSIRANLAEECRRYSSEHKINPDIKALSASREDFVTESAIEKEVSELRGELFSLEAELSSLYEEISREDELKERRLELSDALENAQSSHKTILKASEHLALAKERLTSKYLGKMRHSFESYMKLIASENGKQFTIDTDFSVKKTENGLTNKIESYSLGMREMYSLIARFALTDALYEKNHPFMILDDPFCHFDDEKCKEALDITKNIASAKQIIYLTCSDSRAPR